MARGVLTRLVKARTFPAWWRRLIALERALPEDMTDEQWHTRGQPLRLLLADLMEIGRVAGAVLPSTQEHLSNRIAIGQQQNPPFD